MASHGYSGVGHNGPTAVGFQKPGISEVASPVEEVLRNRVVGELERADVRATLLGDDIDVVLAPRQRFGRILAEEPGQSTREILLALVWQSVWIQQSSLDHRQERG